MMYSISDKPKVCPVCQSERLPSDLADDRDVTIIHCRCGAVWAYDLVSVAINETELRWVPMQQCPWATNIAIELLAGKVYAADMPRFKQAGR